MTVNGDLCVAGITARPGSRVHGRIRLLELADGTPIEIPVILVNGIRPGPRLYLGAAIHGDEVNGVAMLGEALGRVTPTALAGQIVCVAVQHPLAFHADHRLPLAQFLKSPLDQAPADAWTCFPGSADGNLAQMTAARLFELIRACDYAVDIHTPTRGGRYVPISILPHPAIDADGRAEALARGLGSGWIMKTKSGFYVADGILCVEATRAGVPCFTFEIGEGGRLEPAMVRTGADCILNAMQWLKMIDLPRKEPVRTQVMQDFVGLRATRGGLLYTDIDLGDEVRRGDVLCRIVNVFGEEVERVTAPVDGLFIRATTLSTVSTGDRVATLGIL